MSTIRWQPVADAVAQVSTGAIASVDATPSNNTFTVTIGGVAVTVTGTTNANTTAAALVAALVASTHPYFTAITWTNPSGANITGTANEAGVPFTAVISKAGAGTGTVTAFSTTTANTGPNVYIAANFSGGILPANGDTLIFENSSTSCLWGLDQSGVTLAELRVMQSYTGLLGLDPTRFVTEVTENTGSTSETYTTGKIDYRDDYLKIGATLLNIGQGVGQGSPRLKVNVGTVQTAATVYNTRGSGIDANQKPCRLLGTHASNTLTVHGGSVGIATSTGSEVSTFLTTTQTGGSTSWGQGVTYTNVYQSGGELAINSVGSSAVIHCAGGSLAVTIGTGTLSSLTSEGGHIKTFGGFVVTNFGVSNGGRIDSNSSGTITLATVTTGGTLGLLGSAQPRTITTLVLDGEGALEIDPTVVTLTNNIGGPAGPMIITAKRP